MSPARIHRRIHLLGWLCVGCVVLFVVLYFVAVETAWGQRAGNAALAGRRNRPPDLIDTSLDLLSTISVLSLAFAGGAICLIGLIRGGWRLGFGVGIVILFSNVTTQVLKNDVLTRPFLVDEGDIFGWGNSLPSGHATVAMSLVVGLGLVLPPRVRWLGVVPTTLYAIGIGVATITAGWHRPSDAMAAYLVVVFWGGLVAALLLWSRDQGSAVHVLDLHLADRRQETLQTLVAIGAVTLAIALITLLGVVLNNAWATLTEVDFDIAYFAGIGSAAAAAILTVSALMLSLVGIDLGGIDEAAVETGAG